ncbi:hypothetical protein GQR36_23230 [Enterococcus termitis]
MKKGGYYLFSQFKMPTKIITGEHSLSAVQSLSLSRVLIICDPFMEKNGTAENVTSY